MNEAKVTTKIIKTRTILQGVKSLASPFIFLGTSKQWKDTPAELVHNNRKDIFRAVRDVLSEVYSKFSLSPLKTSPYASLWTEYERIYDTTAPEGMSELEKSCLP